jgi:hypothetical protein
LTVPAIGSSALWTAVDKSDSNDLFSLLVRLKCANSAVFAAGADDAGIDAAIARMKQTARALYCAIDSACRAGYTVRLYSPRGGGRLHLVRTVGPMNPDGTTFRYSSEPEAGSTLSSCVMVAMSWIDVAGDSPSVPRCA